MPRVAVPPPHSRFFARLDRFTCECPACGQIIQAHLDHRRGNRYEESRRRTPRRAEERTYNPHTSRLCCPRCHKTYQVGLVLYPVKGRASAHRPPPDTVPDPRQLLAIRQQAGVGFWAIDPLDKEAEVNLAIAASCSCPQPSGWAAACPIHGWIPRGEGGESAS